MLEYVLFSTDSASIMEVGRNWIFQAPCFFPLQGHFLSCSHLQNLPLKLTWNQERSSAWALDRSSATTTPQACLCSGEGVSNKYSSQSQPEARFIGGMRSQDKEGAEGGKKAVEPTGIPRDHVVTAQEELGQNVASLGKSSPASGLVR